MHVETEHLRYDLASGQVTLMLAGGDEIGVGRIEDAGDELPTLLLPELEELRDQIREQRDGARAYRATVNHGYEGRIGSPGRI